MPRMSVDPCADLPQDHDLVRAKANVRRAEAAPSHQGSPIVAARDGRLCDEELLAVSDEQ
jgi:hypothetical protein